MSVYVVPATAGLRVIFCPTKSLHVTVTGFATLLTFTLNCVVMSLVGAQIFAIVSVVCFVLIMVQVVVWPATTMMPEAVPLVQLKVPASQPVCGVSLML